MVKNLLVSWKVHTFSARTKEREKQIKQGTERNAAVTIWGR